MKKLRILRETIMNEKRKKIEKTRHKKDTAVEIWNAIDETLKKRAEGYNDLWIIAATGVYVGGE